MVCPGISLAPACASLVLVGSVRRCLGIPVVGRIGQRVRANTWRLFFTPGTLHTMLRSDINPVSIIPSRLSRFLG